MDMERVMKVTEEMVFRAILAYENAPIPDHATTEFYNMKAALEAVLDHVNLKVCECELTPKKQTFFIKTSGHSAKCTGCGNIVHCLDLETAICPLCAYEQFKEIK